MNRNPSSNRNLVFFALAAALVVAVTAGALLFAKRDTRDLTQPLGSGSTGQLARTTVSPPTQKSATDAVVASVAAKGHATVIVQIATNLSPNASAQDQVRAIAGAQDTVLSSVSGSVNVVNKLERLPLMVLDVDAAGVRSLAGSPGVVSLMEDQERRIHLDDSIPLIGGPAAYTAGATGRGWSVAVLDTGFETSHSFFGGRVVAEACFSTPREDDSTQRTNCPNGKPVQIGKGSVLGCPKGVDGCEHGTHVAGIAAGNGSGGSGVAKEATIVAVQVFHTYKKDCDEGTCVSSRDMDIIAGLEWVLANHDQYHVAAVNMSLGGAKYATQEACDAANGGYKVAIDALVNAGIAVVISSGNDHLTKELGAPGCVSSAIAVGSTTKSDKISDFSNSNEMLDLLAPGDAIVSYVPGNSWDTLSGTSMAAPHVAGAFTALRSIKPDASVAELFEALWKNGKNITDARNGITRPRIQLDKAVQALRGGSRPQPTPPPAQPKPQPTPIPSRGLTNDDVNNPKPVTTPYYRDDLNTRSATIFDDPVVQPTPYCEEGGRFDHTVWYSFTAPANGYLVVSTEGSTYDTIMTAWQGTRGNSEQVACNDDDAWPNVLTTTIGGWIRAGTTFRIQVGAWDDGGDLVFQAWFKADNAAAQYTTDKLSPIAFDEGLQQKPSDLASAQGVKAGAPAACRVKATRPAERGSCFAQ